MNREKKTTTPEIRFPWFTGDWAKYKLQTIVDSIDTGKSIFDKDAYAGKYPILGSTSVIGYNDEYDYEGDFILTARVGVNAGSLYRYAGKVKISDNTVFIQATQNIEFLYYLLAQFDLKKLSFGTGQPLVKTSELKKLELMMPTNLNEQIKIGEHFSNLDTLIALHQHQLDDMKEYKKGLLQKMFPKKGEKVPELRFTEFTEDWEEQKLNEVTSVAPFKPYLKEAEKEGDYEVIQQGDNPVLGYAYGEPFADFEKVTLFGDHTLSLYKPISPFFVATDGLKILYSERIEGDLYYYLLERYKPDSEGYKRHFSILKECVCSYPKDREEQRKIGDFFNSLDKTITLHQQQLDDMKEYKRGLLQKMFV